MSHVRRTRLREGAWYACYLAALVLALTIFTEQPASAQCPFGQTTGCIEATSGCPPWCYAVKVSNYSYMSECQAPICRYGICFVFAYDGSVGCTLCTSEPFSHCVCCLNA